MSCMFDHNIVETYMKVGSIKETAKLLECSEQKVRKTLITAGVYTSDIASKIGRLRIEGLSVSDISNELKIARSTVFSYLPYERTSYKLPQRSVNAMRIEKCKKGNKK